MRLVSVFANSPCSQTGNIRRLLRGRWRVPARAVMVLLSLHGLSPAQIAVLPECHPSTGRRWIGRFNADGVAGLADRPRYGRPRLGGRRLTRRIAALLNRPGPWTLPRIRRCLGRPQLSWRTLYRRVRLAAVWRRPKLTARGGPCHDHAVAVIVARLIALPRRAVVLAEDETHLNLLPHVRASWTRRGIRPQVPAPGKDRQVTVSGALEVTAGTWVYRLGRRRSRTTRGSGSSGGACAPSSKAPPVTRWPPGSWPCGTPDSPAVKGRGNGLLIRWACARRCPRLSDCVF